MLLFSCCIGARCGTESAFSCLNAKQYGGLCFAEAQVLPLLPLCVCKSPPLRSSPVVLHELDFLTRFHRRPPLRSAAQRRAPGVRVPRAARVDDASLAHVAACPAPRVVLRLPSALRSRGAAAVARRARASLGAVARGAERSGWSQRVVGRGCARRVAGRSRSFAARQPASAARRAAPAQPAAAAAAAAVAAAVAAFPRAALPTAVPTPSFAAAAAAATATVAAGAAAAASASGRLSPPASLPFPAAFPVPTPSPPRLQHAALRPLRSAPSRRVVLLRPKRRSVAACVSHPARRRDLSLRRVASQRHLRRRLHHRPAHVQHRVC